MLTALTETSWLGVIVVTIVNFIFGGIYFGVIIAKMYAFAMGREKEERQKPSVLMIAGPAVCGLLITMTSGAFIKMLNIQTLSDALIFGSTVGIGYFVPMTMTIAINPNFPRPFLYTAINAPYFLASSLLTSSILVLMN
ncbi:MAG: DUF1761 domain-containing protein [Deltaproteobacteria bacterium]|jgi:hypothetical protein|nr:DUF1761 domain-containing protein [Deltaproteobacteria bacterium]